MKLIIAGGRTFEPSYALINGIIQLHRIYRHEPIVEIVSGAASGVDTAGELWASEYNVKVKKFPANWDLYGKSAGPLRNQAMAKYADALLLIWDGESRGSASMKREMEKLKKPIYEAIFKANVPEQQGKKRIFP